MDKNEFYALVNDHEPADGCRLNSGGTPLNKVKQGHLNRCVAQVRALRAVYASDPLIKEVCTNLLAGFILVDGEGTTET